MLGNIGPQSFFYGPSVVLPQPQANIPQYGPDALLVSMVRGYYITRSITVKYQPVANLNINAFGLNALSTRSVNTMQPLEIVHGHFMYYMLH